MNGSDAPFDGKTIVVSGASSGIGRATAIELASGGATLILVGRNRDRLDETAAALPDGRSRIVELELGCFEKIMPAIRDAAGADRLYGLCHAAGTVETLQFSASTPERVQSALAVNYQAGMELARAVCRRDVIEPDGGSIVFISAIYAHIGKPGQIAYSGSKGAVVSAARAMAIELARRKIRVNVVSPGMVRTEMIAQALSRLTADQLRALEDSHPLGFGEPEDVARAVSFLLSPANSWITAADLIVDGGCSAH